MNVCICAMYVPSAGGGSERDRFSWSWNYRWLWAMMCVLRTEPESSARAGSTLSSWAISLDPVYAIDLAWCNAFETHHSFWVTKLNSIEWIYHNFLFHSHFDGHLSWFQFETIILKVYYRYDHIRFYQHVLTSLVGNIFNELPSHCLPLLYGFCGFCSFTKIHYYHVFLIFAILLPEFLWCTIS